MQRDGLCVVAMRGQKCTDRKESMAKYVGVNIGTLKKAVDEVVSFGWLLRSWEDRTMVLRVSSKGTKIDRVAPNKSKAERCENALHRAASNALHRAAQAPCTGRGTMYRTKEENYEGGEDMKTDFYEYRRKL